MDAVVRAPDLTVFADADEVARAATERFYTASRLAVRERGRFVVALAGGATPRRLHRRLGAGELRMMIPWSRTQFIFGDERCVPPDDERSNYRMACDTLFDHVRLDPERVIRIEGEQPDPDQAAARYEARLRTLFPGEPWPRIDLAILGMGVDGHTASLLPGSSALDERERWAVVVRSPRFDVPRITLTLPALCHSRQVLFLVTGGAKAEALARVFGGTADPRPGEPLPAALVIPTDGEREILVDRTAAARLPAIG